MWLGTSPKELLALLWTLNLVMQHKAAVKSEVFRSVKLISFP